MNSILNRLYPTSHTVISLDKFLGHLENNNLWFLNNLNVLDQESKYVLINIVDQEQDEIVFINKMLVSGDRDEFITRLIQNNSKNKFSEWLQSISDQARYIVNVYIVPSSEKKTIAVINQYFCSANEKLEKETNTSRFLSLFKLLEEQVNIKNIGAAFFVMFSMLLISIVVTLLLYGFPLSAITVESLVLVTQEVFLVIGFALLFLFIITSVFLLVLNIIINLKYPDRLICKKELSLVIKQAVVYISLLAFTLLIATGVVTSSNFFRVSDKQPMMENPIIDRITNSYIGESSLPSIQEVIMNDANQSEIILMMGIRENVIYYYPQSLIKKIVKEDENLSKEVCTDGLYPANTIQLLKSGKLRRKKNQRVALNNTKLISEYHGFSQSFCDLNTSIGK